MATLQRHVEVVTAGCPLCLDTVRLVTSLAIPSYEVQGYSLWEGCATNECREKAARYGVTAVQAVDRKSTRLNSSHIQKSRMPSSA